MYIQVKLLNRALPTLTYKVPESWDINNLIGSFVKVPLKNQTEIAYIEDITYKISSTINFSIKEAHSIEIIPKDRLYNSFVKQLSSYYAINYIYFFKRIYQFLKEKELKESIELNNKLTKIDSIKLTKEQQYIFNKIEPNIVNNKYYPSLIYGVTGSGKTEIYKQLIISAIEQNKSVLLLLPEVSLAIEFYNLLKLQLPENFIIYGFHSATSIKEKRLLWHDLNQNKNLIIIGVHLPILLPINNLGLIIVDEEHDTNFQSQKHPKINVKEASLLRAKIYNIPIVMGSATPSITSLYNAEKFGWEIFELKERFAGNFPKIQLVKLNENKNRKNFWITKELEKEIAIRLEKKEQIIIFINRRGYSFFIQCKECSNIPTCINCSVSLTVHNKKDKINKNIQNLLICHYCTYFIEEPKSCIKCNKKEDSLIKKGIGTQQIVTILEKLFPTAKIARADLDSTVNKKNWQQIMQKFNTNEIDILVGTQTITKGYNFKNVTLVGLLWADINLGLPFYNAAEVTLQQLIQVSGRAGRQSKDSLVIIQTMLEHKIYNYINETEYRNFYEYEIKNRALLRYPPYIRFAEIEIKNKDAELIENEIDLISQDISNYILKNNLKTIMLGPVEPPVSMIKNVHIRKIYLKCHEINNLIKIFMSIEKDQYKSQIFFTPNPLN